MRWWYLERGASKLDVRDDCESVENMGYVICTHCEHGDDIQCASWVCIPAAVSSAVTRVLRRSIAIAASCFRICVAAPRHTVAAVRPRDAAPDCLRLIARVCASSCVACTCALPRFCSRMVVVALDAADCGRWRVCMAAVPSCAASDDRARKHASIDRLVYSVFCTSPYVTMFRLCVLQCLAAALYAFMVVCPAVACVAVPCAAVCAPVCCCAS
jgi:hypothetical protein